MQRLIKCDAESSSVLVGTGAARLIQFLIDDLDRAVDLGIGCAKVIDRLRELQIIVHHVAD